MKVYTQTLFLKANQTVRQTIEYTPPSYLQGEYELVGVLSTSDGLPLASNFLGRVTLKATTYSYLEIKSNTCSLRVKGESETTTYNIQQGVDVDSNEAVEGVCVVDAHTTQDTTATPSFVTHRRSIFGEIVSDTKDIQKSVTFKKNETKTVSFILPKAFIPQSYDAVLSLVSPDGTVASNEVAIHYVLRGPSATVQNVLLDKDRYLAGNTARVSISWTGPADSFRESRKRPTNDTAKNVVISIKDGDNNSCAEETAFAVPTHKGTRSSMTEYPLPITRTCVNPQVMTKIADVAGAILVQKTIGFTNSPIPENAAQESFLKRSLTLYGLGLFAVLIAIIFGAVMFIKK